MFDIFNNKGVDNIRINEINSLMSKFGYNNCRWENEGDTFIYKTEKDGNTSDNIKIEIGKFKAVYIKELDINPLDPILLCQLYDKLNTDIRKKYPISKSRLDYVLIIIRNLIDNIQKYKKNEYDFSTISGLYMMVYYPIRDLNFIYEASKKDPSSIIPACHFDYFNKYFSQNIKEELKTILCNHQKDLDLFSREEKYVYLTQSDFNYKTDDESLLISLLKCKKRKYFLYNYAYMGQVSTQNIECEPDWWHKLSFSLKNEICSLKYASDELLNNKKFIIKYINESDKDLDILNYIPDSLKTDSDVINTFLSKKYTQDEIESSINKDDIYVIGEDVITLKSELSNVKRRKINKSQNSEEDIKKRKKVDFVLKQKKSQENGLFAESLVFEFEKQRLVDCGREDLADSIVLVSKDVSDNEGFDILSFDPNTNKNIYIEVKSSEKSKFDNINISAKEYEKLKENPNSWKMYFVSNIKDEKHDLYIKTGEELLELFDFKAKSYEMKMKDLTYIQENNQGDSSINPIDHKRKGI